MKSNTMISQASLNQLVTKKVLSGLLLFISFLILYYPVFLKLIHDWEVDPDYSHGYFIPLIALFMVWMSKDKLKNAHIASRKYGLVILILGLLQLTVSWVGNEYFLQGTSMILVLLGMSLFLGGPEITKILAVPMLYLVFMVPLPSIIWNKIAFPLALFASTVSAEAISALGISILREGNILTLSNITLQVAEACSGLRSLITLLALSAFLAFLADQNKTKKIILFLSAVPIALLSNAIRLVGTAVLARYWGASAADGFIHGFSGWAVFVLGLGMLVGVKFLLDRVSFRKHPQESGS